MSLPPKKKKKKEEDGKQPFDCWLKRHTCLVPNIQKLRQQYHDMISAALVMSSDGQSEMDKIDRTLAKMWADAAQRTEPNDAGTATDVNSADTSTADDTRAPPANTKGQRTNIEVNLGCKAAKPARHAAKQPTLHAKRRLTRQRSNRTKCNLSTRGHQGKRHQSTVKTNSSTHESQNRLGSWLVNNCLVCCLFARQADSMQALVFANIQVVRVACSFCCGWPSQTLVVSFIASL